jgi:putative endonuclease
LLVDFTTSHLARLSGGILSGAALLAAMSKDFSHCAGIGKGNPLTPYNVYMLQCADGSYYVGLTSDLSRRLTAHEIGADTEAFTYSRRPVKLVWTQEFMSHDEAFACERQIKGWSRAKKVALVERNWEKIHNIVRDEHKQREQKKRSAKTQRK